MGVFYHFQPSAITSSLLHRLLYALLDIFMKISIYLYNFQRVSTRYYRIFSRRSILIFFLKKKLMVTRVMRWKIHNYYILILLTMYRTTFSNTSGNVLKIVTYKNDAELP